MINTKFLKDRHHVTRFIVITCSGCPAGVISLTTRTQSTSLRHERDVRRSTGEGELDRRPGLDYDDYCRDPPFTNLLLSAPVGCNVASMSIV